MSHERLSSSVMRRKRSPKRSVVVVSVSADPEDYVAPAFSWACMCTRTPMLVTSSAATGPSAKK